MVAHAPGAEDHRSDYRRCGSGSAGAASLYSGA